MASNLRHARRAGAHSSNADKFLPSNQLETIPTGTVQRVSCISVSCDKLGFSTLTDRSCETKTIFILQTPTQRWKELQEANE